ncbi:MAG: hypothetical protein E2O36_01730 [Proteobacteria bacterium]|nr:MAG: hypothetical protein E2O36_01730 [Pseudomonadota bacterium]
MPIRNRAAQASQRIRLRLAAAQAGTALSFLGLVAGLLAGGLIGATIFIGAIIAMTPSPKVCAVLLSPP